MKPLKLHITLFFLLMWSFSYAQKLTNFTTKDGLPSNHVYKVIQDANGYIWIGTDKGLVKYNGETFKTFTTQDGLATNDIWGLNVTPDGKVWYQSKAAKVGYVLNDSVHAFKSENKDEVFNSGYTHQIGNTIILNSGIKSHQLINNNWQIIDDNKNYTNYFHNVIKHKYIKDLRTFKYNDTLFLVNKNNQIVKQLFIKKFLKKPHKRGQLTDSLFYWANPNGYKILNLNTLKLTERTFKDEVGIRITQHSRINIINKQLQIAGRGFVGVLDSNFYITKTYYMPKETDAHFGFIDKNENIWLNSLAKGVFKLPKEKRNIRYKFNNKKVNFISQINNNIVATVYKNGFYRYNPIQKKITTLLKSDKYLHEPTYLEDIDTEFYSEERQSYYKKNKRIKKYGLKHKLRENLGTIQTHTHYTFFKKYIYARVSFGINKIDPKTNLIIEEFVHLGVKSLFKFNNQLLIATSNGLFQFKNNSIQPILINGKPFNKSIFNIHKISDTEILLNTDGFGAFITDFKSITQVPKSEFLIVNNASVQKNELWLATNKGVFQYQRKNKTCQLLKTLTVKNGLPSNQVNDVFLHNNQLLVATDLGLAILPKNQIETSQLLDVYIENVKYNNQNVSKTDSVFKYQSNNSVNFSIASLDFSEDKTNFSYNYKLAPLQKKWTNSTLKTINYNSLQPRDYTFSIQHKKIKKEINFTIQPLWWQTLWFKFIGFLLFTLLVFFIFRYSIRKNYAKRNKVLFEEKRLSELQLKALRSQMNPHFVFNSLSAIQYYINNNQLEASEIYLVKFSKLIRQFFEWTKEKEIPLNEEIKLLTNYLDIEKLRFKDKFEYSINVDKNLNTITNKLPTMLLQPIVENAINHGIFNKMDNGNVILNFIKLKSNSFKVEIIDDGVGFVNTKKQGKRKLKSSNVLEDRLLYLNKSKEWSIRYAKKELHPNKTDKGNIATFIITQL